MASAASPAYTDPSEQLTDEEAVVREVGIEESLRHSCARVLGLVWSLDGSSYTELLGLASPLDVPLHDAVQELQRHRLVRVSDARGSDYVVLPDSNGYIEARRKLAHR